MMVANAICARFLSDDRRCLTLKQVIALFHGCISTTDLMTSAQCSDMSDVPGTFSEARWFSRMLIAGRAGLCGNPMTKHLFGIQGMEP